MAVQFSLEDLFNVMIELESVGNIQYTRMRDISENPKVKGLFNELAEAELSHKRIYEHLKLKAIHYNVEVVDEDYLAYVKVLLENTIAFIRGVKKIEADEQGYDVAVQLEHDTIEFLQTLKKVLDPSFHKTLDDIIAQEEGHLKTLEMIKMLMQ